MFVFWFKKTNVMQYVLRKSSWSNGYLLCSIFLFLFLVEYLTLSWLYDSRSLISLSCPWWMYLTQVYWNDTLESSTSYENTPVLGLLLWCCRFCNVPQLYQWEQAYMGKQHSRIPTWNSKVCKPQHKLDAFG